VSACRAVGEVIHSGLIPAALEIVDQRTIVAIEDSVYAAGLPRDAGAILIAELDGPEVALPAQVERVRRFSAEAGASEVKVARDAAERLQFWRARKGAFGAMGRLAPDLYVHDAVVPRAKLPEVLAEVCAIGDRHGLTLSNVFHAGDGNLHPNISFDRRDPDQLARVMKAGAEILDWMSSWVSHLPAETNFARVAVHGMNAHELDANPRATDRCVQNLNAEPELPYASESFDAAVNAVSVQYLVRPVEVFASVRRVLRPGGRLVISSLGKDADISRLYTESATELTLGVTHLSLPGIEPGRLRLALRNFLNDASKVLELEETGAFQFWEADELVELVSSAGFGNVEARRSLGIPPQAILVSGVRM